MTSFTTIEETAMLMNDTPTYEFACHYYNTKYGRLKGILAKSPEDICEMVVKRWEASFNRFTANDGNSWSMNWFRLRRAGTDSKPWFLPEGDRDILNQLFTELLVAYPTLQGTLHIVQISGSDTLLLAGHITKR